MKISVIRTSFWNCAFLVEGSEKNAVIDCGQPFAGMEMADKLKKALNGKQLDYIIPSHSHYDHIGGMPAILHTFPGAKVYSSAKTAKVFKSEGAKALMRKLAEEAALKFEGKELGWYDDSLYRVDEIAEDGYELSLGDGRIVFIFSPGHTNCSYSFYMPEISSLIMNESIGPYHEDASVCNTNTLTGFKDALASLERCRALNAKNLYSLHSGKIEGVSPEYVFSKIKYSLNTFKDIIIGEYKAGKSHAEILSVLDEKLWKEYSFCKGQPLSAFNENMNAMIKVVIREFCG